MQVRVTGNSSAESYRLRLKKLAGEILTINSITGKCGEACDEDSGYGCKECNRHVIVTFKDSKLRGMSFCPSRFEIIDVQVKPKKAKSRLEDLIL